MNLSGNVRLGVRMRKPYAILLAGALAVALNGQEFGGGPGRAAAPQSLAAQSASASLLSRASAASSKPPVLGVDIYIAKNYAAAKVQADATRDLIYIQTVLGAKSIGIVWNLYSPDKHSEIVRSTKKGTLSPAKVELITKLALADGFTVQYRPLVKEEKGNQWEGTLSPADPAKWFASYYRAELPYLRAAEQMHVQEFVVGTELAHLEKSVFWAPFLRKAGKVYGGVISYAHYAMKRYYRTWRHVPVRKYAVTAYPAIKLPDSASVARLVRAWEQVLHRVPSRVLAKTAIDEIGIPALDGAYRQPWNWRYRKAKLNETVQARWFTTACKVAKHYHMRAVYFWNVNLTVDPYHPPFPSPPTFEGKKGATAIKGCLQIFG